MSLTLSEYVEQQGEVQLYGARLSDLAIDGELGVKNKRGKVSLAIIRGYAVQEHYVKLPVPLILTVFGEGRAAEAEDERALKGNKIWTVNHADEVVGFNFEKGPALDLLETVETKGIKGGLAIRDLQYSGGTINGRVEAWFEICVFGKCAKGRETFGFSIPVEGCHTIFEFAVGSVKACVTNVTGSSAQICFRLCVGKWGLEKCWDQCATVNFLTVASSGCGCKD